MLKSVKRMKDIWLKNRTWLIKQTFHVPSFETSNHMRSFMAYRDRILYENVPPKLYYYMTDSEKDKMFKEKFWTGRRVNHYNHRIESSHVIKEEWTKTLPPGNVRYSELINGKRRIKQEIRDAMLIKPSRTALYKGTVPFPLGSRPQKYRHADSRFYQFHLERKGKYPYDPFYHDRVVVEGAWATQHVDFQALCDPKTYTATYSQYENAIRVRGHKLLLPMQKRPKASSAFTVQTNASANPGLLCSRYFGHTHRKADPQIRPIAKELFGIVSNNLAADTSLWTVGGRNRQQKLHVDKVARSRSLLMPEGVSKILGLILASPLYDDLANINFNDAENEIRIGGNDFHGSYFKFAEKWGNGSPIVEADISRHDANTSEESMVVAFGIVRSLFPPGKRMDNLIYYIMSGFIFKNVAIPGRFVFRCLSGIPTGSPFTSIIVSLVNWLNWSLCLTEENSEESAAKSRLAIFGDDTLLEPHHFCENTMWDCDHWSRIFKERIGHTLDPVKLVSSHNPKEDDQPTFLKTIPMNYLPGRPIMDTVLYTTTVRKKSSSDFKFANNIKALFYAAPFNFKGLEYLMDFRKWLTIRYLRTMPAVLQPPSISKYADSLNRVSITASFRQYLYPYIYNWDVIKNVDLGNKPKQFTGVTTYASPFRRDLYESGYFFHLLDTDM